MSLKILCAALVLLGVCAGLARMEQDREVCPVHHQTMQPLPNWPNILKCPHCQYQADISR